MHRHLMAHLDFLQEKQHEENNKIAGQKACSSPVAKTISRLITKLPRLPGARSSTSTREPYQPDFEPSQRLQGLRATPRKNEKH